MQIKVSLYVSGPSQYRKYSAYNKDFEINLAFLYKYQYIAIKVNSHIEFKRQVSNSPAIKFIIAPKYDDFENIVPTPIIIDNNL